MVNWSPFDPEIDRRLVTGLNEGDEDTLATLYDIYVERLYDYCTSMTQEPKAAADIVHDIFIDASRRAPRMRNRARLRSWLYAAARRRCLLRTRGRGLYWDWSGETATGVDPDSGLPLSEVRSVLEGMLERLDFSDQETLLLALRHGVTGDDLAAVFGVPVRRANAQAARAWSLAESAVAAEVLSRRRRCVTGQRPGAQVLDGQDSLDEVAAHATECPDCRGYGGLSASALFEVPPAPVVPAGLRHRVMHTGTDPELAGYRVDIAARGGHLNPDGVPRQPDVPSPIARRWIFTGGGVMGALVSLTVAAFIIGPGLPNSEIVWPWHGPSTQGGSPSKGHPSSGPVREPAAQRGGPEDPGHSADPVVPQLDGHPTTVTPTPKGSPGGSPQPLLAGQLVVVPAVITLLVGQETYVELSALHGPVTWNAVTSNAQLELAAAQGVIPKNGTYKLRITLKRLLVQLPGTAVITFTCPTGQQKSVKLTWGLSLLRS
jgi:RNA polymerase sigma factor (sigma-70 family)